MSSRSTVAYTSLMARLPLPTQAEALECACAVGRCAWCTPGRMSNFQLHASVAIVQCIVLWASFLTVCARYCYCCSKHLFLASFVLPGHFTCFTTIAAQFFDSLFYSMFFLFCLFFFFCFPLHPLTPTVMQQQLPTTLFFDISFPLIAYHGCSILASLWRADCRIFNINGRNGFPLCLNFFPKPSCFICVCVYMLLFFSAFFFLFFFCRSSYFIAVLCASLARRCSAYFSFSKLCSAIYYFPLFLLEQQKNFTNWWIARTAKTSFIYYIYTCILYACVFQSQQSYIFLSAKQFASMIFVCCCDNIIPSIYYSFHSFSSSIALFFTILTFSFCPAAYNSHCEFGIVLILAFIYKYGQRAIEEYVSCERRGTMTSLLLIMI